MPKAAKASYLMVVPGFSKRLGPNWPITTVNIYSVLGHWVSRGHYCPTQLNLRHQQLYRFHILPNNF